MAATSDRDSRGTIDVSLSRTTRGAQDRVDASAPVEHACSDERASRSARLFWAARSERGDYLTCAGEVREATHRTGNVADDAVRMTSLSVRAAARRLGVSAPTLREWSDVGVGPLPDELGRYGHATVTGWLEDIADQLRSPLGSAADATATPLPAGREHEAYGGLRYSEDAHTHGPRIHRPHGTV
jgi:hypothetical protein